MANYLLPAELVMDDAVMVEYVPVRTNLAVNDL